MLLLLLLVTYLTDIHAGGVVPQQVDDICSERNGVDGFKCHTEVPIPYLPLPVCTAEGGYVVFEGTAKIAFNLLITPSGNAKLQLHVNAKGTGTDNGGTTYQFSGIINAQVKVQKNVDIKVVLNLKVVGQGVGLALGYHLNLRLTFDDNWQLIEASCNEVVNGACENYGEPLTILPNAAPTVVPAGATALSVNQVEDICSERNGVDGFKCRTEVPIPYLPLPVCTAEGGYVIFEGTAKIAFSVMETPSGNAKLQLHVNAKGTGTDNGGTTYQFSGIINAQVKVQKNVDIKVVLNLKVVGKGVGLALGYHLNLRLTFDDNWQLIEASCNEVENGACAGYSDTVKSVSTDATVVAVTPAQSDIASWAWALIGAACATIALCGVALVAIICSTCLRQRLAHQELLYVETDACHSSSGFDAPAPFVTDACHSSSGFDAPSSTRDVTPKAPFAVSS